MIKVKELGFINFYFKIYQKPYFCFLTFVKQNNTQYQPYYLIQYKIFSLCEYETEKY